MLILIIGLFALVGFGGFVVALFGCCVGAVSLVSIACSVSLVSLCAAWALVKLVERG